MGNNAFVSCNKALDLILWRVDFAIEVYVIYRSMKLSFCRYLDLALIITKLLLSASLVSRTSTYMTSL